MVSTDRNVDFDISQTTGVFVRVSTIIILDKIAFLLSGIGQDGWERWKFVCIRKISGEMRGSYMDRICARYDS
jgi:hypothetical protein